MMAELTNLISDFLRDNSIDYPLTSGVPEDLFLSLSAVPPENQNRLYEHTCRLVGKNYSSFKWLPHENSYIVISIMDSLTEVDAGGVFIRSLSHGFTDPLMQRST